MTENKQFEIYQKENEQLKQTVSDWVCSYDELLEDVKRLEEENEQLKEKIDKLEGMLINNGLM